jgi:hypothetical protein
MNENVNKKKMIVRKGHQVQATKIQPKFLIEIITIYAKGEEEVQADKDHTYVY